MGDRDRRRLEVRELKLLQERTRLQQELERCMRGDEWPQGQIHQLTQRREQLDGELAKVREEIKELHQRDLREAAEGS